MIHTTAFQSLILLIPALPLGLWIAFTDLKYMRITNKSVMVLAAAFAVLGIFLFPMEAYLWRLAQVLVVLAIGFVLNALRLVGGGDAKYAAAMAAYFAASDLRLVLLLFAAMLIGAFVTHRIAARVPALRNATQDWKSWTAGKDFPMGLALSGTLLVYLLAGALQGA